VAAGKLTQSSLSGREFDHRKQGNIEPPAATLVRESVAYFGVMVSCYSDRQILRYA
jgi:hypothetical protein